MRLPFLKHLLDATAALCRPERIIVLGSSSLLPGAPQLGESGQPLEVSLDADLLIDPMDEPTAEMLKEAIGTESLFEKRNGYYADILRPIITKALPAGWESRLHPVAGYSNVFALDAYDLALVKLQVGRQKDMDLLRALFRMKIIEPTRLQKHYQDSPLDEREAMVAGRNLRLLLDELGV